jgi:hypothetical protein
MNFTVHCTVYAFYVKWNCRRDDPTVGGGGEGGGQEDGGEGRLRGLPGGRPPLLEAAPQAVPQLRGRCRVDQESRPAPGSCSGIGVRSCLDAIVVFELFG